jgi:hypothetical protein
MGGDTVITGIVNCPGILTGNDIVIQNTISSARIEASVFDGLDSVSFDLGKDLVIDHNKIKSKTGVVNINRDNLNPIDLSVGTAFNFETYHPLVTQESNTSPLTVSASSEYHVAYSAWQAYDENINSTWATLWDTYDNTDGSYLGAISTTDYVSTLVYNGEYIQIELDSVILCSAVRLMYGAEGPPASIAVFRSDTGGNDTWTLVNEVAITVFNAYVNHEYSLTPFSSKHIRLVVRTIAPNDGVRAFLTDIKWFGVADSQTTSLTVGGVVQDTKRSCFGQLRFLGDTGIYTPNFTPLEFPFFQSVVSFGYNMLVDRTNAVLTIVDAGYYKIAINTNVKPGAGGLLVLELRLSDNSPVCRLLSDNSSTLTKSLDDVLIKYLPAGETLTYYTTTTLKRTYYGATVAVERITLSDFI